MTARADGALHTSAALQGLQISPSLLLTRRLLSLHPKSIWAEMTRQPVSVWAVFAYLFFEYVRPQTIYPVIDVLPWARLSLIVGIVSMFLQSARVRRWSMIDSGMVVFSVVVVASSLTAIFPEWSRRYLDLYASWVLIYAFVSTSINTQTRVVLMLLGWFLWNLKMTLHAFRSWAEIGFAFRDWGVTGAPGWFQNSGEFGIQTTVILPISLYFALGIRPYVSKGVFLLLLVLPFTALTGAIASSSRGALLGMAVIGIWMLARSRYKVRGLIGLAITVGFVWVVLPPEQKARFTTAGEDNTSVSRFTYWERGIDLANEYPLLGIGYKNWLPVYLRRYGDTLGQYQRAELPHNIFIEAVSELGYIGLFALLFLLFATFWLNAKTRALARKLGEQGRLAAHLGWGFDGALIGFIASGSFVTVLYYPYLWINLAMTVALHLSLTRTARAVQAARGRSARNAHRGPLDLAGMSPHPSRG